MSVKPSLPFKLTDPGSIVGFAIGTALVTLALRWALKKVNAPAALIP